MKKPKTHPLKIGQKKNEHLQKEIYNLLFVEDYQLLLVLMNVFMTHPAPALVGFSGAGECF